MNNKTKHMREIKKKSFKKALFGSRLKKLREQLGINQIEMGTLINRTRVSYVLIEGGKTAPSADCIMDILSVLKSNGVNVSLDYLFGETDHQNETDPSLELKGRCDQLQKELEQCQKISSLQDQLLNRNE